jgi:hypothetical protein
VGFILQRPLDVIVGDQDWPGNVLGDGKERQQKNYCKKSESHKQKFTSRNGNQNNGRSTRPPAAKKAGDLPPAC